MYCINKIKLFIKNLFIKKKTKIYNSNKKKVKNSSFPPFLIADLSNNII